MIIDQIEEKVKAIIARMLVVDISEVVPGASLDDLGADSLDIVEIILELEEAFDIYEISDEEVGKINTVRDFIECITKRRQGNGG
jgi:acyl carrier protein